MEARVANEAKQHTPINPMGLKRGTSGDAGGIMDEGVQGKKVSVGKGEGGPGQKSGVDPKTGGGLLRKGEAAGGVMK
jgi:hypothetical protein